MGVISKRFTNLIKTKVITFLLCKKCELTHASGNVNTYPAMSSAWLYSCTYMEPPGGKREPIWTHRAIHTELNVGWGP